MTKEELIDKVAAQTSMTRTSARQIVDLIYAEIARARTEREG
jgi:nucleoid DNA-binding protein